jgi:hypothetical protein
VPPVNCGYSAKAQMNATQAPHHGFWWRHWPSNLRTPWFNAATAFAEA